VVVEKVQFCYGSSSIHCRFSLSHVILKPSMVSLPWPCACVQTFDVMGGGKKFLELNQTLVELCRDAIPVQFKLCVEFFSPQR